MQQKKSRNTCLIIGLVIVILCLCSVVVLGAGGYYLYTTGKLTYGEVLNWFNLGPAEIQISNFSDDILFAELTYTNQETGETNHWGSKEMGSYDISSFRGLSAGNYQLTLSTPTGLPQGGTCYLTVKGGDLIHFMAVPEGVGVILTGAKVSRPEEINLLTSPLCQP
ncbi:MAG: hypothetical protein JW757_01845 [Anaerolineales bacterium]|nr:hypothetical protein [Anaerolineales bacterium]